MLCAARKKNESVPIRTFEKVCAALDCNLENIVEILQDDELKRKEDGHD